MPHLTRRAWLLVGLGVAGLTALGVTIAGAQTDGTPRGTDPLSTDESQVALDLARGSNPGEATGVGTDDVVLLVERHDEPKNAAADGRRRADVYVYSYDDDVLTLSIIDVASGTVERSTVLADTQLPLVPEEGERALELALADAEFRPLLATAYRQATGQDLTDPTTELLVQPIVFLGDSIPGSGRQASACGRHRCAQLFIRTTDDLLVEVLPVVDLSTEQVISDTGIFP